MKAVSKETDSKESANRSGADEELVGGQQREEPVDDIHAVLDDGFDGWRRDLAHYDLPVAVREVVRQVTCSFDG